MLKVLRFTLGLCAATFACAVMGVPQIARAADGDVELWAVCRKGVKAAELVEGLKSLNPASVEAVDECVVKVVFQAGNEQDLREKVAMSFGVAGVTDVDISKDALATTAPTGTVPSLPEPTQAPTSSMATTTSTVREQTTESGRGGVLPAVGVAATAAGLVVLAREVQKRRRGVEPKKSGAEDTHDDGGYTES